MKKLLISLTLLTFVLSAFAQGNYQDVVHLKNGSIIKGIIIEQVPSKQLKIETADGSVFVYQMDEIEKMAKEQIGNSGMRKINQNSNFSSPTAKGRIIFSGSSKLGYSSMTNETKMKSDYGNVEFETDAKQFNFQPSIGWFVADGFAIALTMDYESSKQENDNDEYKESTFMFGPSLTYYFGSSTIKPFIQGEYLFGNNKSEQDDLETKIKMNGWGLGAGVAFFLNEYVSIDFGLGYANISGESDDDYNDREITVKGVTFGGGISVYF